MKIQHKILVAQSDPGKLNWLEHSLKSRGYEVAAVTDGAQALKKTVQIGPDLLLADTSCRTVSGIELTQKVKADPATRFLPVVLSSSKASDRGPAIEAGCDDFLAEPFQIEELLTRIETLLRLSYYRPALDEGAKLESLLDYLGDGIVVLDQALKVQKLNRSAREFLKMDSPGAPFPAQIRKFFKVHHAGDLAGDMSKRPLVFDIERPETQNSRPLILEVRSSVVRSAFRGVYNIVAVMTDVTALRQKAYQEEIFLNFISHKLRTPLSIIHKNASMFQKGVLGPLDENQKRFSEMLYEKCCELVEAMDKLLGYTTVKGKALDISDDFNEVLDLKDTLSGISELFSKRQNGRCRISVLAPEGVRLRMNRKYFEMVIKNILENAVKFALAEPVEISVNVESEPGVVAITISDNGPGIAPEEHKKIFEPFYQVDKDRALNVRGTGLGLAIVKQVVEAYKGSVGIKSEPGHGASFCLRLPLLG